MRKILMSAITAPPLKLKTKIPVKSIALPIEHGAWGFLFEPLLTGLLIAPSLAAPFILLLVSGAFLTRQPLKFLAGDLLQKKRLPRMELALRFVLIFGGIAAAGLIGCLFWAPAQSFIPFIVAAPIVIYLVVQ